MTLYKITQKETKEKHYAKNRSDIRRLTNLSETSLSKIIAKARIGHIVTCHKFIIEQIDIDESTIKEVKR